MKIILSIAIIAIIAVIPFFNLNVLAAEKLRFIADYNIPTGEKFKETEIGGLSGITFDSKNNKILAISDDRSVVNDARFYEFSFVLDDKNFHLTPTNVVILTNKEGKSFPKGTINAEDIALFKDDVLVSSVGWINRGPPINPEIFAFSRDGKYKSNFEIPSKFNVIKDQENKFGARVNLAFASLTVSGDGNTIWAGTEEALNQDGPTSSPKYSSTIRLVQYKGLSSVKEVAYHLEKVPSITVAGLTVGETGLTALLAIDDSSFYSIERSYLPLSKKNIVRIFKFKITEQTTDVSKMDSLKGKKITAVEKEFIANLEDFTPLMTENFKSIDKIEGMGFGPKLANGHATLLFVSDNNFNKKKRTQFMAFEIIP